jgi:hypothetical protein
VRNHIRIRRFLNRPGHHAGAYVIAVVGDSESCRDKDCSHQYCIDVRLSISDCARLVALDFDLDDAAGRRNSMYKINTLIDALVAFRAALEIEVERAARRPRRRGGSTGNPFLD